MYKDFDSYSCRVSKGTHAAVARLQGFVRKVSQNNTRPCWALKCDIRKFFDSIDHRKLMELVAYKVKDMDTIRLVEHIVSSFAVDNVAKRERDFMESQSATLFRNCSRTFT